VNIALASCLSSGIRPATVAVEEQVKLNGIRRLQQQRRLNRSPVSTKAGTGANGERNLQPPRTRKNRTTVSSSEPVETTDGDNRSSPSGTRFETQSVDTAEAAALAKLNRPSRGTTRSKKLSCVNLMNRKTLAP